MFGNGGTARHVFQVRWSDTRNLTYVLSIEYCLLLHGATAHQKGYIRPTTPNHTVSPSSGRHAAREIPRAQQHARDAPDLGL